MENRKNFASFLTDLFICALSIWFVQITLNSCVSFFFNKLWDWTELWIAPSHYLNQFWLMVIRPLWTNFSEILFKINIFIQNNSFENFASKMVTIFCFSLNVLRIQASLWGYMSPQTLQQLELCKGSISALCINKAVTSTYSQDYDLLTHLGEVVIYIPLQGGGY